MPNIASAQDILRLIGMPSKQYAELPALTLLAMANLTESSEWEKSTNNWIRIHDIILFVNTNYGRRYAENSRETFRKQAIHHFIQAGIIENNNVEATNSPNFRYRITSEFQELIQKFGSNEWDLKLNEFLLTHETLKSKYESKRNLTKIPVIINALDFEFSTGKHNELQKAIIEEFAPRFAQNTEVIYIGDTTNKFLVLNEHKFKELKIEVFAHDKLPDVVLYDKNKNWLYFIEAVTSVGEITPKRIIEIEEITKECDAGNIYITAFQDFKTYKKFANSIAWETEVWFLESPEHMIHLNGDRFMGPRD